MIHDAKRDPVLGPFSADFETKNVEFLNPKIVILPVESIFLELKNFTFLAQNQLKMDPKRGPFLRHVSPRNPGFVEVPKI